MRTKFKKFLDILLSPDTHESLELKNNRLVTKSGLSYQVVKGVPILMTNPTKENITAPPAAKISQNIENYRIPEEYHFVKRALHLGSGNVPSDDPRVLSLDILPCDNVDIVAEAENLPFKDNSFDYIDSCAVFEHVYNPLKAVQEAKRVLKPGGVLRIDNTFMQPYHGYPSHFFNMTTQANETYLIDDFLLLESYVPESGTALMTLRLVIDRVFENISERNKKELLAMPVKDFIALVKSDLTSNSRLMEDFSDYSNRSLAATHVIMAKKPENYEKRIEAMRKDKGTWNEWEVLKRQYYALRMELMLRYHEIFFYKRCCYETDPTSPVSNIKNPKPIESILHECLLKDPLNKKEISAMIEKMQKKEASLKKIRDQYITIYLTNMEKGKHIAKPSYKQRITKKAVSFLNKVNSSNEVAWNERIHK